jgi:hypothetical protein
MGLLAYKLFYKYKVLQGLVININLDSGLGPLELGSPLGQRLDNSKYFLVVDLIITLNRGHSLREVGD